MIRTDVPLAPFTTFRVGGPARFFAEAHTLSDVDDAIAYSRAHTLQLRPFGAGSNLLIPDDGIPGVVLKVAMGGIACEESGDTALVTADAGAAWEEVVDSVTERELFGIENLAGIPGTVGGAVVQNIGAYGAELKDVFEYADAIEIATGVGRRFDKAAAAFGYRDSFFKRHRGFVITSVTLRLMRHAAPNLSYPDLARASAAGVPCDTPQDIAHAVRAIRSAKFPHGIREGTAGSFFKNPVVSRDIAAALVLKFPGMPLFPQGERVKVPLAWVLDQVLSLKGFSMGNARLYEKHPLIIVARAGARAEEIDALAREVEQRVFATLGLAIEREVETFGAQV